MHGQPNIKIKWVIRAQDHMTANLQKKTHLFHCYSVDTFKIPHSILDSPWSSIDIQVLKYLLNLEISTPS
jgi:hypothetical protein